MNNLVNLASNYFYKFGNQSFKNNTKPKNSKENEKNQSLVILKKNNNYYNFCIAKKYLLLKESIRKAEEFAKKQSIYYCPNHAQLIIKPQWCLKCNKYKNNLLGINSSNSNIATVSTHKINQIDFAILGLFGLGCISYMFYWKR